jgi:hypothetical protein
MSAQSGVGLSLICVCCLAAMTAGCASSPKIISRNDFHNDVQQAASLASESVIFADLNATGKTTSAYAAEHPKYLEHQAEKLLQEINKVQASADQAKAFERFRSATGKLSKSLKLLHDNDSLQLQTARDQLEQELQTFKALEADTK